MKKIYHNESFEADWFFDEDMNLLHHWSGNDAQYRQEYMKGLFTKLGVDVVWVDNDNPKVIDAIRPILADWGIDLDEELAYNKRMQEVADKALKEAEAEALDLHRVRKESKE